MAPQRLDSGSGLFARSGKAAVDDFIALEHPSSFIDGAYARVIATLRRPEYPDHLSDLAIRIASEGMEHESHFIDIKAALAPFNESEYLRPNMQVGTPAQAAGRAGRTRQDHRQSGHGLRQGGP